MEINLSIGCYRENSLIIFVGLIMGGFGFLN